jgi:hypothetical protein
VHGGERLVGARLNASGAKVAGTTAELMTLVAQVFRLAHPRTRAAAAPR